MGRPRELTGIEEDRVRDLLKVGWSYRKIAQKLETSVSMVQRVNNRNKMK